MSAQPPLVLFSYASSPYGQKIHLLLTAAGIPYSELPQPAVLPRPDLEALGVTYRRIPVLAIGRDVYADSSAIIDVILNQLGGKDRIVTSKADKAFETWGNDTFKSIMPLLPAQAVNDAKFAKDRATIFPIIAKPELLQSLQPTALADLKSRMTTIEEVFLADGPYIGGDKISLADVHVIWVIRWVLLGLGAAKRFPGLDKFAFPKVWNLIASLPKPKYDTLDRHTAIKTIKDAKLSSTNVRVMQGESSGIAQDAAVIVESADTKPGAHPQKGNLIGTTAQEIILGLDSGVQLHFPRQGYILREASDSKL